MSGIVEIIAMTLAERGGDDIRPDEVDPTSKEVARYASEQRTLMSDEDLLCHLVRLMPECDQRDIVDQLCSEEPSAGGRQIPFTRLRLAINHELSDVASNRANDIAAERDLDDYDSHYKEAREDDLARLRGAI